MIPQQNQLSGYLVEYFQILNNSGISPVASELFV